jgi:hypothetical protein
VDAPDFSLWVVHTAKAYLLSKEIKTCLPNEHKKTYNELKKFVDSGKLDQQLLDIYTSESEKADVLLNIFYWEKRKRGRFTYNVNANANIPFAKESLENSKKFASLIKAIIENEEIKEENKKHEENKEERESEEIEENKKE